MKIRTFTLQLDPATGRFDDRELQEFLQHRQALDVSEHFFVHERIPTWALLVSYRETEQAGTGARRKGPRPDPAADLSAEDRPLYDALRHWRNERAKREGRPAYVLFTNRQMADIARRRPDGLSSLEEIPGIGEGRARDLGEEVLALVRSQPPRVEGSPGEPSCAAPVDGTAGDTPGSAEDAGAT
jgi:superfamily II DNA helicase RecQ